MCGRRGDWRYPSGTWPTDHLADADQRHVYAWRLWAYRWKHALLVDLGNNVEHRFGHALFLLFYLSAGLVGSLAQILLEPDSVIPSLGASGAIAGVMGAYLVLFPHNRVNAVVFYVVVTVPAVLVLGMWIVMQLVSSVGSIAATSNSLGGVAYLAHVGGFVREPLRLCSVGCRFAKNLNQCCIDSMNAIPMRAPLVVKRLLDVSRRCWFVCRLLTAPQPQGASRGLGSDGRWPTSQRLLGAAVRGIAGTIGGANRG